MDIFGCAICDFEDQKTSWGSNPSEGSFKVILRVGEDLDVPELQVELMLRIQGYPWYSDGLKKNITNRIGS